jgi:hypothetical protein
VPKVAIWAAMLLIAAFLGFGIRSCTLFNPQTTVTSLSPDDKWRVTLIERRLDIDRNFQLRLEKVGTEWTRTVFRSPDEGRPIGSERIVWSKDGSRFLLLGRHFYQTDADRLSSGEQPYLMMDVPSGRIWCNAHQQTEFPKFDSDHLGEIEWLEWTPK